MTTVDYMFLGVGIANFYMIVIISQWAVAYYQAKRYVPNAIFDQFHGEMIFPRRLFYAKLWRSLDAQRMPTLMGKNGNLIDVVVPVLILTLFIFATVQHYYFQGSTSALVSLVITILMLLISRFWMIKYRLLKLKQASSLQYAYRKGREF